MKIKKKTTKDYVNIHLYFFFNPGEGIWYRAVYRVLYLPLEHDASYGLKPIIKALHSKEDNSNLSSRNTEDHQFAYKICYSDYTIINLVIKVK